MRVKDKQGAQRRTGKRRNEDTWNDEIIIHGEDSAWINVVKTVRLTDDLFLEFGRQKGGHYRYVSLMQGDYRKPRPAQQLYFSHPVIVRDSADEDGHASEGCLLWYVYDDTATRLVEPYGTKKDAVQRLRLLADRIITLRAEFTPATDL